MSDTDESNQAGAGTAIVCPESSFESAGERDYVRRRSLLNKSTETASTGGDENANFKDMKTQTLACESTVDSSLRRDFIKKAAIGAMAVGIGATVLGSRTGLGKKVLPSASAFCCSCNLYDNNVTANYSVYVDSSRTNNGSGWCPGLNFGGGGGEGISSARACGSQNQYGLDFYTNKVKRVTITNSGNVGINTVSSCYTLDVNGSFRAASVCVLNCSGSGVNGSSVYNCGVAGTSYKGVGVKGFAFCKTATPIVAQGAPCQSSHLQEWQNNAGTSLAFVDASGNLSAGSITGSITSCCAVGVTGKSALGTGIVGDGLYGVCATGGFVGVYGTGTGGGSVGVEGVGLGAGLIGYSQKGYGLEALTCVPVVGKFRNGAISGDSTALVQFETGPFCKPIDWNAGVAGLSNACKIPDGSFYIGQPSKPMIVVNSKGDIGIGTTKPTTTLQVNGSVAAKVDPVKTANYSMTASDFAILASGAITITLPAAKTANGMIVFIKNVSISTVKVTPKGTDTIEGKSSSTPQSLSTQYASLTLISNGSNEWFVLSNAT